MLEIHKKVIKHEIYIVHIKNLHANGSSGHHVKVTNKEVLRKANEDRQILNSVWQRKHRWTDHVLRHDGLLCEITEGRMKGKPTRGRRKIQMLHDLTNDQGAPSFSTLIFNDFSMAKK